MSSRSSRSSDAAGPGRITPDEIRQLCDAVEEERGNKSLIVIPVCHSKASAKYLEESYRSSFFKRSNKRIIPTTSRRLSKAISCAGEQAQSKQKLMLLVSPYVASILFHVPSKFHMVTLNRCGELPPGKKGINGEDQLLIDESSTFCNITLTQWENRPDKFGTRRFCILGQRVYLQLNFDDPAINIDMPSLSKDEKIRLTHAMRGFDSSIPDESSFWDKWKGAIATLLGAIAGVVKFTAAIKVTSAGFYCSHWLGLKLFGGYISTTAYVAASGPAVVMAFGTAAAIYFIPWDRLWAYFQRIFGKIWDGLSGIWHWIMQKLSSLSGVAEDHLPPPYTLHCA